MPINFTPKRNERIYKVVNAYNKRIDRANREAKIGKDYLPEKASIYALKHNYDSWERLDRELKNLEAFTRSSARQKRAGFLSEYDTFLIENNRADAKKFFEHQYKTWKKNAKPYRSDEQAKVSKYEKAVERLSGRLDRMSEEDLIKMAGDIDDYRIYYNRQGAGYRGFLEEINVVMRNRGIPPAKRNDYFRRLNELTPEEFYEFYVESNTVERLYELLDSPEYKQSGKSPREIDLNASDEEVDRMLESLDKQLDAFIAKRAK